MQHPTQAERDSDADPHVQEQAPTADWSLVRTVESVRWAV
jgi:hypothetical protein